MGCVAKGLHKSEAGGGAHQPLGNGEWTVHHLKKSLQLVRHALEQAAQGRGSTQGKHRAVAAHGILCKWSAE